MVYCINVSNSRGVPETIYSTWDDNNNYFHVVESSQDELVKNGFLGSLSHEIFFGHVLSDCAYEKIVKIISPHLFEEF